MPSPTDKIIQKLNWLLWIILWAIVIINYKNLPTNIATHFNLKGQADSFGSKQNLLALPIFATVIGIVFYWLMQRPNLLNYPTTINAGNAKQQYTFAIKLLRWLQLIITSLFLFIVVTTLQKATNQNTYLGKYFIIIVIVLILATLAIFIHKMLQKHKN